MIALRAWAHVCACAPFSVTLSACPQCGTALLLAAFSVFPDLEYCVLSLPHASNDTALLSKFSLATPAVGSTFEHVLYIINRATLLCPPELVVRKASVWDKPAIMSLVSGSPNSLAVLKSVTEALPYEGNARAYCGWLCRCCFTSRFTSHCVPAVLMRVCERVFGVCGCVYVCVCAYVRTSVCG